MRKFLSCPFLLLLPLLFCSCGRISEQCLLIDSADTCRVTTDQKVTLIRNGLPHDYHMPSTKDFFNGQTLSSSDISADSSRIYVYRCGDKFAASRINIEHARALRNAVAAGKYSPADILPSCALWFLAAFVIGCAAYCCRATDKRIMITVGSTLAMLFFASAGGKTSSFVTEGTLWEKEGSCIRLDNGRFILSQGTDICDNWHLFLGQRVYVYRYDDIYFASGEKFSPATLAYTETIPNFTGLYLVCWLCAMALGYWTYATAGRKIKTPAVVCPITVRVNYPGKTLSCFRDNIFALPLSATPANSSSVLFSLP